MLTVLHRGPDGAERIFEAESVIRFSGEGESCIPAQGDIRACLPDGSTQDLGTIGSFGAVFVMNRYGQTVARYT